MENEYETFKHEKQEEIEELRDQVEKLNQSQRELEHFKENDFHIQSREQNMRIT